jgi:predicted enzyme related to lactoylglutathione lyase
MDKVVHFEIPADDLERAQSFYQNSFGWETQEMPEFKYVGVRTVAANEQGMPTEPGAINGGMFERDPSMPHPQVYIDVTDIEAALRKVAEYGGEVVRGKTPVGEMGFVANFKDSEGNILGLWQVNT